MIYNVHIRSTRNVGDSMCGPWRYLNGRMQPYCLYSSDWSLPPEANVVVGGGNLFHNNRVYHTRRLTVLLHDVVGKKIVWGAGMEKISEHFHYLDEYDLVGLRNYGVSGVEWTPCVTCLDRAFDAEYEKTEEVVVYQHYKHLVWNPGVPEMGHEWRGQTTADAYFRHVIEFLGSAETVVTASYHGAYWATLLGCRVLAYPAFEKLRSFKHEPVYVDPHDWMSKVKEPRIYMNALEECRDANHRFMGKVFDLCA